MNKEKRLMRVVWNDNNWETPIKRNYNPSLWKDGKNNASFEKSFGFGGEDWLFNSRYNFEGFQYGYIRGVDRLSVSQEKIDELYLYSIDPISKNRLIVAKIYNVEIIEGYDEVQEFIQPILNKFINLQMEDLKIAEAHLPDLNEYKFKVNVRFKMEDVTKYGYFYEIQELKTPRFNRFTPIIIDSDLEQLLLRNLTNPIAFVFKKGKSKSVQAHKRNNPGGEGFNKRTHTEITDDLYKYLIKVKSINKEAISIENSRVGGRIIDGVIQNLNNYSFFEIKTLSTATSNIREALGQLIEYSHLDVNLSIDKLIIVGPAKMKTEEVNYFNRIKDNFKINLEYWAYNMTENDLVNKFKIY